MRGRSQFNPPDGDILITLHHLNNLRLQRIIWLLEELSLDYEIKRYERDAKTTWRRRRCVQCIRWASRRDHAWRQHAG